jgi:hypothetical protein
VSRALREGYAALHGGEELGELVDASRLGERMLRQVPPDVADPSLPLLHANTAALAAAAARNDTRELRRLLLPRGHERALPSLLVSFNVMVAPDGHLVSLPLGGGARARAAAAEAAAPCAPCSPFVASLFEAASPPPPPLDEAYVEAAVGGPRALADLRRIAPGVRFLPYWPLGGGEDLVEEPARGGGGGGGGGGSSVHAFYSISTPRDDERPARAGACGCDAWDDAAGPAPQRARCPWASAAVA